MTHEILKQIKTENLIEELIKRSKIKKTYERGSSIMSPRPWMTCLVETSELTKINHVTLEIPHQSKYFGYCQRLKDMER